MFLCLFFHKSEVNIIYSFLKIIESSLQTFIYRFYKQIFYWMLYYFFLYFIWILFQEPTGIVLFTCILELQSTLKTISVPRERNRWNDAVWYVSTIRRWHCQTISAIDRPGPWNTSPAMRCQYASKTDDNKLLGCKIKFYVVILVNLTL